MAMSKTAWARQCRKDYAKMKSEDSKEFNADTAQITNIWKNGFKVLKDENDRLQDDLMDWYSDEMGDIANSYINSIKKGPPEGVSKKNWEKGLREDKAKMEGNVRDERNAKVKEISRKWKEGFKRLKEENDKMQFEAKETLHEKLRQNDEWLREQLRIGPPQ